MELEEMAWRGDKQALRRKSVAAGQVGDGHGLSRGKPHGRQQRRDPPKRRRRRLGGNKGKQEEGRRQR